MQPLSDAEQVEIKEISGQVQEFFKRAHREHCGKPGKCGLCCGGCAKAVGHFTHPTITARERSNEWFQQKYDSPILACQLQSIKDEHGWDKERGFLTAEGCRLPWHRRSVMCLESTCHYIEPLFVKSNMAEFRGWVDRIRMIRREHGMIE